MCNGAQRIPVCCNAAHPVAARCNTLTARCNTVTAAHRSPISSFLVDVPAPLHVGRRSAAVRLERVVLARSLAPRTDGATARCAVHSIGVPLASAGGEALLRRSARARSGWLGDDADALPQGARAVGSMLEHATACNAAHHSAQVAPQRARAQTRTRSGAVLWLSTINGRPQRWLG